jgi:hypothetical protein
MIQDIEKVEPNLSWVWEGGGGGGGFSCESINNGCNQSWIFFFS